MPRVTTGERGGRFRGVRSLFGIRLWWNALFIIPVRCLVF